MRNSQSSRRAFTLVEMLVVMSIIALLAGISVYAFAPFRNKSAVNNGGVLLQSWLTAAKQRALRDQRNIGIRLLAGDEVTDDSGIRLTWLVTKCVFIEQQDDIVGTLFSQPQLTKFTTDVSLPLIVKEDYAYMEINGGLLHQIKAAGGNSIELFAPISSSIPQVPGATFRIYRSPKTLTNLADAGSDGSVSATEDILRMPFGAGIHLKANVDFPGPTASLPNKPFALTPAMQPLDIVFTPGGSVLFPSPNYDKIVLWVTATNRNSTGAVNPLQGQPNCVVVNSRTGFIAGYTIDIGSGNPYSQIP